MRKFSGGSCFQTTRMVAGLLFILIFSCRQSEWSEEAYPLFIPLGLDSNLVKIPPDNPLTKSKVDLGRKLYFDERLSVDATISCAFCHNPLLSFTDGRYFAMGVLGQKGPRNSSTVINRVFGREQFFDGRAKDIEGVVLEHIQNRLEMNNNLEHLVKILEQDSFYKEAFQAVFKTGVTAQGVAKATASFVRTLVSGNSLYDQYVAGNKNAVPESARRGIELFYSERLGCSGCHSGPNLTDEKFHNNGAGQDIENPDPGLFNRTGLDSDRGKFKTPTLRDISRTSPFMHNGSLKSLMDVVDFYDQGGIPNPNLDEKIKPLHLTMQEKGDLVEFLRSLNGSNELFMGNQ